MNLDRKLDLDGVLRDWPAPDLGDDAAWEERAARITRAATAGAAAREADLELVLAEPPLEPELGEPREQPTHAQVRQAGETKMSQASDDQDEGRPSIPEARSSTASIAPGKKRMSLKEMAERASQSGFAGPPSRTSDPSVSIPPGRNSGALSTPIPPAISTPLPPALSSRPASIPPAGKPAEAGREDSGVINLKAVTDAASPEQKAKAAKAQPASSDLDFDDAASRDAAEGPKAERRPAAVPITAAKKKGSNGLLVGAAIAVVGLAASFAILRGPSKPAEQQPQAAAQPEQTAPQAAAKQAAETPAAAPTPTQPSAMDPSQLPEATAATENGKLAQGPAGAAPSGAAAADSAAPAAPAATVAQASTAAAAKPAAGGKPGDLNSAMQAAVGDQAGKTGETEAPEPAAGRPLNQTVPEQPPQGSIQAAIRSVMPSAKACIAGADDVSKAQVTFSSSGTVTSVSVTGWAASHGQSGCVKSAFQAAKVGAFSKPSFSVPVTIRP
ncbi:hypothetical protein [Chondromyces apiculatus]|uniref:Alginate regulatory protein AlgP n=1 Tax=Chondromyces apiculatus DSM 436 TaxID=1192034 RepID=A0A017T614_9BACT|nr:hypothetical protein [Chondromyces apiculatus]EYF04021.1 alginate regulatory protein AlgP [Chondromyces apiculatus DSM 436]